MCFCTGAGTVKIPSLSPICCFFQGRLTPAQQENHGLCTLLTTAGENEELQPAVQHLLFEGLQGSLHLRKG